MRIGCMTVMATSSASGIGRTTVDTLAALQGIARETDITRLDVTNLEYRLLPRLSSLRPLGVAKKRRYQEWGLPIKQTIEIEALVLGTQTADLNRAAKSVGT